jgi:hypothetical protein
MRSRSSKCALPWPPAATLRAATEIAAAGYLDCLMGPEYERSAALLAYEETKDDLRESRTSFAEAYHQVFAPFVALKGPSGRAMLTGLVGVAAALASDTHAGTIGNRVAIDALATIMLATLEPLTNAEWWQFYRAVWSPRRQTPSTSAPARMRLGPSSRS